MSAGPVLVLRVQGEAGAQGFADVLRGWRMSAPDRGGWHTLKLRGDYAHVRKLGELLRVRFSLSCCRCSECAAQINTGRDCMGELPQRADAAPLPVGKRCHDFADSLRPILDAMQPTATARCGLHQLIIALHYVGDDADTRPEDYTA